MTASQELDLAALLDLYDRQRYLDAYAKTRHVWEGEAGPGDFAIEHVVHGARLAGRLGGQKVSRWLLREAIAREPDNPLVRYFGHWASRPGRTVLDVLREYERQEELNSGDPRWDASWLADEAHVWATMRDFERAHRLLDRADEIDGDAIWVACNRGWVLFLQDRWDEALAVAEEVWRERPGLPSGTALLGSVLVKLGRLAEAGERILTASDEVQSYEVLAVGLWHLCARAERCGAGERVALAHRALEAAERMEELTPLADRYTRSTISACRFDAAMLAGDRDLMRTHAAGIRAPFVKKMLAHLDAHAGGRQIVLAHRVVFQKHKTCLPSSVAAVLGAFERDVDVDELSQALTYDGTPTWRTVDWLAEHSYASRQFVVTPDLARRLLGEGLPFVLMNEYPGGAHATAAIGLDEAAGLLLVHDPGQDRWSRIVLDRLADAEAPMGPEALAIVPAEQAESLAVLDESASAGITAYNACRKVWETVGPGAAGEIVADLAGRAPDEPLTRRVEALHLAQSGSLFEAIQIQQDLLEQYPQCLSLQRETLGSLRRTRDTVRVRETLEHIVQRGCLPGIQQGQDWRYPPAVYVSQYADMLGLDADGYARAEHLLRRSLRREPLFANTYHILADVYARQDRHDESILPFLLAAGLEEENDHFARAAADALHQRGRVAEAMDYLLGRARRLGSLVGGGTAWTTCVAAMEEYGYPEQAVAAAEEAARQNVDDPFFHAFATEFWLRMGRSDRAKAALDRTDAAGHRPLYLAAAVRFHQWAGRWEQALRLSEESVRQSPDDTQPRYTHYQLLARKVGWREVLTRARAWAGEHEGDEAVEELLYALLRDHDEDDQAEQLVRDRLARNPLDSWAWLELCHTLMGKAERKSRQERAEILAEAADGLEQYEALCPRTAPALALRARLAENRGESDRAAQLLLEALEVDPSYGWCYARLWDAVEDMDDTRCREVIGLMEQAMLRVAGPCHGAGDMATRIAARFGLAEAEQAVKRWTEQTPDDPELIQASADLLLQHGRGRQDAQRAAELLEPAVRRFPNHFDLHFSLAHAYDVLLRENDAYRRLRDVLQRNPLNTTARRHLAELLAHQGKADQAETMLREGVRLDPHSIPGWHDLARLHLTQGRADRALAVYAEALGHLPENLFLREQYMDVLHDTGDHAGAVRVAGEAVAIFPDGAYCHYMLANALFRSQAHTDVTEIEASLRRALELNFSLYDAAELLSAVLCTQQRFEEARSVIIDRVGLLDDQGPARVQLAWITRQSGADSEAVEEMAEIVKRWPGNLRGWWLLMDWLEEDKEHERVQQVLADVPPQVREQPNFASRRLVMLQRAGVKDGDLDAEWDLLLDNFPDNESIHLRRFDLLLDRNDTGKAQSVLQQIERFCPLSPFFLARKVRLQVALREYDQAVATALLLWQQPGCDDPWPDHTAWRALASVPLVHQAVHALYALVRAGTQVHLEVFELFLRHIEEVSGRRSLLGRLWPGNWFRPTPAVALLEELLVLLGQVPWDRGQYRAAVLDAMTTRRATARVRAYWQANESVCRELAPLWASVGHALLFSGRKGPGLAREWMADWRDRTDVEMWALTNYSLALRRSHKGRGDPHELYATSRDALDRLQIDHTAKYHVCSLCEGALRLGKTQEFLQATETFAGILREDEHQWMPDHLAWLSGVVDLFRRLLVAENEPQFKSAVRGLAAAVPLFIVPWCRECWMRIMKEKLPRSAWSRVEKEWRRSP